VSQSPPPPDDERESSSDDVGAGGSEADGPGPDGSRASLRPISAGALTGFGVVGLVAGWSLNRIGSAVWGHAPLVTWSQVVAPFVAAMVLGIVARVTWLHVQRPRRDLDGKSPSETTQLNAPLHFQHAVNRVVLARASALVGCLVAGGYLGYAVSWLWRPGDYATSMAVRSAIAGVGAIAMTLCALALQRACRVRSGDDST
jgi:Protein of unknown function (DUF3180)